MHRSALLLALLFALCAPAAAQNLLQNGRFDVNVGAWGPSGAPADGTYARNTADAHGYPGSGSLEFTNRRAAGAGFESVYQCVAAGAGSYTLRGYAYIPTGQLRTGDVALAYGAFNGPNCTGGGTTGSIAPDNALGNWVLLQSAVNLPAGTVSVLIRLRVLKIEPGGEFKARFDDLFFGQPCTSTPTRLCLGGQRFAASVTWQTPDAQSGAGVGIPFTGEAGYFWFFAPGNVELVVKEVDACSFNQRRWIFVSGLTSVKVDLTVTDFETNTVKTYHNPQGTSFVPVLDTSAFATCP